MITKTLAEILQDVEDKEEMPDVHEVDPSLDLRRTDYVDWDDVDRSGVFEE